MVTIDLSFAYTSLSEIFFLRPALLLFAIALVFAILPLKASDRSSSSFGFVYCKNRFIKRELKGVYRVWNT